MTKSATEQYGSGPWDGEPDELQWSDEKTGYVCRIVRNLRMGGNLRGGQVRSCGCLIGDLAAARFRKHGLSGTPEHLIWKGMRKRCLNPNAAHFKHYGGRGITICERWDSFENFIADMGVRPEGMSLERSDNDGPYSPDNCYWATHTEQSNNKRTNIFVEFEGERRTLAQWARAFKLPYLTLYRRIRKGWSTRAALTTPSELKEPA